MPGSFTDHPLSRKVRMWNRMPICPICSKKILQRFYFQIRELSEVESLRDSEVQLM